MTIVITHPDGSVETVEVDVPVVRLLLGKSVVTARVSATGKLAAVFTWLMGQPELFARWVAPDQPNVYADDPDLAAALAAGGLTDTEIATVTAAP